jgi:hypothetical protein
VPTLLRDAHFVLERYDAPAFVRLARTAFALRAAEQVTTSLAACRAALGAIQPAALGILLDWRLSSAPRDAELQREMIRAAQSFAEPFARAAVLLLPAGASQDKAVISSAWGDSARLRVFHDEEAAIGYVSQG